MLISSLLFHLCFTQITLEATHHGPYMEIPSCFVEIGSTEVDWELPYAGELWVDCLSKHLGLGISVPAAVDSSPMLAWNDASHRSRGVVVVGIGGGHYVPKMNDMVSIITMRVLDTMTS